MSFFDKEKHERLSNFFVWSLFLIGLLVKFLSMHTTLVDNVVGIPDTDGETQDAVVFGFLTFWFLSEVCQDGLFVLK